MQLRRIRLAIAPLKIKMGAAKLKMLASRRDLRKLAMIFIGGIDKTGSRLESSQAAYLSTLTPTIVTISESQPNSQKSLAVIKKLVEDP